MKKSVFIYALVIVSILLTGCASTPVNFESISPVAFVTFSSNQNIPYELEEVRADEYGTEESLLSNALNSYFGRENPEILSGPDRLSYAEDAFRRILSETAGIECVDKDTVLNSELYSSIGEGILGFTDVYIRGDGYKSIDNLGGKKSRMLMEETGANSLMFVHFTFKKEIAKGSKISGQIRAKAKMEVVVYDNKGNDIIYDEFETKSFKTTEVSKWDYDKDELVEFYPELIEVLINQFVMKYL